MADTVRSLSSYSAVRCCICPGESLRFAAATSGPSEVSATLFAAPEIRDLSSSYKRSALVDFLRVAEGPERPGASKSAIRAGYARRCEPMRPCRPSLSYRHDAE